MLRKIIITLLIGILVSGILMVENAYANDDLIIVDSVTLSNTDLRTQPTVTITGQNLPDLRYQNAISNGGSSYHNLSFAGLNSSGTAILVWGCTACHWGMDNINISSDRTTLSFRIRTSTGNQHYNNIPNITTVRISLADYNGSVFSGGSADLVYAVFPVSNPNDLTITYPGRPPNPPTGLSVINVDDQALLNWNANIESNLTGYNVYRNNVKINTSLITGTTYTDSDITLGNTYSYRVTAVNAGNQESALSNVVSITFVAPEVPAPLSAIMIGNKYSIVLYVSGGSPPYTVTTDVYGTETFSASTYTIQGLQPNTVYQVTVEDSEGAIITNEVNTGNIETFIPPVLPTPVELFQRMIDSFGIAGTIAIAIIGGAVILGIMVILGIWAWRLLKKWLKTAK